MWRGPMGNGISTETDWTSDWPAEGPTKLWSDEVGIGFSSCAVVDGLLYTLGHEPNTPEKEKAGELTNDNVWCIDAATGRRIWHYSYPCKQVADLNEGGPGATPTVEENRVYTLSKEGHLFCFDAAHDGKILWKQELQSLLGVPMPEWGFSCSPRVLGNMLILDAGRTVALDKLTGAVIWKTAIYRPGYGSPTIFNVGGQSYVAVLNNDDLLVVRANDGVGSRQSQMGNAIPHHRHHADRPPKRRRNLDLHFQLSRRLRAVRLERRQAREALFDQSDVESALHLRACGTTCCTESTAATALPRNAS